MNLYLKYLSVALLTCCFPSQATEQEGEAEYFLAKAAPQMVFHAKDRDSCIFLALNHALKVLGIGSQYRLEHKYHHRWAVLSARKFWINLVDNKTGAATPYSLSARISYEAHNPLGKRDYGCQLDMTSKTALGAYVYDKNKDKTIVSTTYENERQGELKISDAGEYAKIKRKIPNNDFPPHALPGKAAKQTHGN